MDGPSGRSGGEVRWWQLDKKIIPWVRTHPTTIRQAAQLWFDGKYKPAAHRLHRLRKRGKIARLDILPRDRDGRPEYQYAGWDVGNAGLHEYHLTEFAMCLPGGEWVRGPRVSKTRRPDGEWTVGRLVYVEFDTGTESETQVREQFDKYRGCQDPLLVVVHNADHPKQTYPRIMRLIAWAQAVDRIAFFVALDAVRSLKWDVECVDGGGKAVPLGTIVGKTPG